jgi:2-dehydropantoate 2-reductase
MVRFGAYSGLPTQLLQASAEIWRSAGFEVKLFEDIERMVWEKLIMNVTFSGSSALTALTIGEIMANPDAWQVARGCAEEAVAVAVAKGVRLEVGDPIEHIRRLGGRIPNARPSMLLDHMAGRRSEIDVINGAIPRVAAQIGLAAPVNETVVALVKAREAASRPDRQALSATGSRAAPAVRVSPRVRCRSQSTTARFRTFQAMPLAKAAR